MTNRNSVRPVACFAVAALAVTPLLAADMEDLAKATANPVAALISVPLQFNYDDGYGLGDGSKGYVNVQPVIPFSLSEDWNLISRTIVPLIMQEDIAGPTGRQHGIGDITQSFFFSPKAPGPGGMIWGVGPVLYLPTATDDLLGADKWGAGPTAVVLKQAGPWTVGALANHIWSFAGDEDRADISTTFMQPFLTYTTPEAWTFGVNSETTYDWQNDVWTVPINFTVGKVTQIGGQAVSFTGGLRYWAEVPEAGPDDIGFRFMVSFLFPK